MLLLQGEISVYAPSQFRIRPPYNDYIEFAQGRGIDPVILSDME